MAHYVTCIYCKQKFNRDKLPTTQISAQRYAHKECADKNKQNKTEEELELEELEKYIMKLFKESYINVKIRKQIKDYRQEYHFTYTGMLKTLTYWYEIKGNSIEKANNGIGIIPYVYKDACKYYYNLYIIQETNKNKKFLGNHRQNIIEIFSPEIKRKKIKLFNFDD